MQKNVRVRLSCRWWMKPMGGEAGRVCWCGTLSEPQGCAFKCLGEAGAETPGSTVLGTCVPLGGLCLCCRGHRTWGCPAHAPSEPVMVAVVRGVCRQDRRT